MEKFCPNCGNELATNAAMCVKCGKLLEENTTNKNDSNKKKKMPVWLIVILIIVGIGIISSVLDDTNSDNDFSENATNSNNNSYKNATNSDNNSAQNQEEIEYIKVSKDDLDDALEKNAAAAKDTYNNKYVEITGNLGTIDSDLKYISLVSSTDKWDFIGIHCTIKNKEQKEIVKSLTRGQEITIRGKITDVGEVLGYYLDITEIINQ